MSNNFSNRFSIATSTAALLLAWFSIATLLAEVASPNMKTDPKQLALAEPTFYGRLVQWTAEAAPLRGDLIANAAVMHADLVFESGKAPDAPEMAAESRRALELAKQALSFAPHLSSTWLMVAKIEAAQADSKAAIDALKMSYLTSPSDVNLVPARLAIFSALTGAPDPELGSLVRGDIRLIMTHYPDLRTAISSAYSRGSAAGKSNIAEAVQSLDPNFAASLQ
jgi:hypothetical protein